jgi:toxin ParE1/3/4
VQVIITRSAEADLADIYAYYAERSGATADRVIGVILKAINGLATFPLMGTPGKVPATRERLTVRYPYRIVYHVDEARQTVEVWRVVHGARQGPPADD